MADEDKPLAWMHGEIQTPPFSEQARLEAGLFLRLLQKGETISLPHSRPMPSLGKHCHELRINDKNATWKIVYHVADDAIVVLEVFSKKTGKTPKKIIEACQKRLRDYYE